MESVSSILAGLGSFAIYFFISLFMLVVFKWIYAFVTPHDEWQLVKEQQNTAAAIGLMGAVIGFAIALAGAISNSIALLDFVIWGVVALIAQILAFVMVRLIFMPKIVERIINNEVTAGIVLAGMSIAVGLLNAACMTY
ncbi:DUF350 domain-containing protein [Thalassotalea mangrovi]|uniref:DUF350 domain-containing protein n=1 Tax=Thalassotalea mangrovi TaxID=2572245 RepID=A0A4U1B3C7_9GAMM|nr:DUF350 domain-containing protein [Thalassotalea mangrovi]TKB44209.1 DUF350 domain-containing protein [Thalassotalea mangrovi]